MTPPAGRVLYLVACAAPPAREVRKLIVPAQEAGWDVCLIATVQATKFIDIPQLEALTRHPVRSEYKQPDEPDVLPAPDAIIVAPATFNTINKWAAGISDTLALGLVTEAIGKGLPVVALPFTNRAHAAHPAFDRSIGELRSWGVRVLYDRRSILCTSQARVGGISIGIPGTWRWRRFRRTWTLVSPY